MSDSETQATLFLKDIYKELSSNEELRLAFGINSFPKEAEQDIIVQFNDGKEFRIMAKGSEQKIRGYKWGNKRPDLIVCDDMENDELVMNKDRREKLRKWFSATLLPLLSDNGIIRMVGTILHFDSLLNSVMPLDNAKTTIHSPLKTRSTINTGWYSIKYRAHDKDFSHLLWKEKRPAEWLRKERKIYEDQGMLDIYSQEYLNNPIDESNTFFRRSDFLQEKPEDKDKPLAYYITFDGAWSGKQQADYSVFLVAGMDNEGFVYIKHVIRDRLDSFEFAELLFSLVKAYDPEMVVSEKGAFAQSILPTVLRKMEEDNVYFRTELIAPTTDKIHRSQAIRLRARAGKVKADKSKDWWSNFEDELLNFPRQAHDDQVDALSLVGLAIQKFYEAPTSKEIEKEVIEEEKQESGIYELGRCESTGY